MNHTKKLFLLFILALGSICAYAQNTGPNDYYSKKYNPRLTNSKGNLNLSVGYAYLYDEGMVEVNASYQLTERFLTGLTFYPQGKVFGISGLYTYDAIPALDGGLFFRIGFEAGIGKYYEYDDDDYEVTSVRNKAFFAPVIQIQHQLCDWLGIYTRAKGLLGLDTWCASVGLCLSIDTKYFVNLRRAK